MKQNTTCKGEPHIFVVLKHLGCWHKWCFIFVPQVWDNPSGRDGKKDSSWKAVVNVIVSSPTNIKIDIPRIWRSLFCYACMAAQQSERRLGQKICRHAWILFKLTLMRSKIKWKTSLSPRNIACSIQKQYAFQFKHAMSHLAVNKCSTLMF